MFFNFFANRAGQLRNFPRATSVRTRSRKTRSLSLEALETRRVLMGLPFGATPRDTGEFLLGSVAVTPVLLESNGQIDPNTENWTAGHIQEVLTNIRTGVDWWVDTLATKTSIHNLSFTIDTTYALTPVASKYEPIGRRSNDYALWVSDFLDTTGQPRSGSLETDMRAFNQAQREKLGTDWSYTIFVVPSQNDADGQFAAGGSFNRAFAFAGGLFMIVPSTRPASTYTHESGHIFWARDEYAGGGSYYDFRGYYNTQNINAANNPQVGFVQQPSIMASGTLLDTAYDNHISPASTLAMIGWQDTDGDGIFDVLDVPHKLTGTGYLDTATGKYRFKGQATVQTLANLNTSGQRNDITINRIREIEVRFDSGAWQVISAPDMAVVELDLTINIPSSASQIEIRARDSSTTVVSNIFRGRLGRADATTVPGINGFVWVDTNKNGLRDVGENGPAGWTVQLINGSGGVLPLRQIVEPDSLPDGVLASGFRPDLTLTAVGSDADGRIGVFTDTGTSTGSKNFRAYSRSSQIFSSLWTTSTRRLQATLSAPSGVVQIDAVGPTSGSYGRLEAYNQAGQLIGRYTTGPLASGQVETMRITRGAADIAYFIAGGHANTNIKLDNLQYGVNPTAVTTDLGAFAFEGLAAGTYMVQASAVGAFNGLAPEDRLRTAVVTANSEILDIDFGFVAGGSSWQNTRDPNDVNDDGFVSPIDVLQIINDINARGSRELRGTTTPFRPYIDVTGDNFVSGIDVLQVINFINARGGT